jgi:hypothetical protein
MAGMDDNPYSAPQTEHKRRLGKIPAQNTGATVVGAVIGGLLVLAWCVAATVLSGKHWHVIAPDTIDLVLLSGFFAIVGGCVGSFIAAVARSR